MVLQPSLVSKIGFENATGSRFAVAHCLVAGSREKDPCHAICICPHCGIHQGCDLFTEISEMSGVGRMMEMEHMICHF